MRRAKRSKALLAKGVKGSSRSTAALRASASSRVRRRVTSKGASGRIHPGGDLGVFPVGFHPHPEALGLVPQAVNALPPHSEPGSDLPHGKPFGVFPKQARRKSGKRLSIGWLHSTTNPSFPQGPPGLPPFLQKRRHLLDQRPLPVGKARALNAGPREEAAVRGIHAPAGLLARAGTPDFPTYAHPTSKRAWWEPERTPPWSRRIRRTITAS